MLLFLQPLLVAVRKESLLELLHGLRGRRNGWLPMSSRGRFDTEFYGRDRLGLKLSLRCLRESDILKLVEAPSGSEDQNDRVNRPSAPRAATQTPLSNGSPSVA